MCRPCHSRRSSHRNSACSRCCICALSSTRPSHRSSRRSRCRSSPRTCACTRPCNSTGLLQPQQQDNRQPLLQHVLQRQRLVARRVLHPLPTGNCQLGRSAPAQPAAAAPVSREPMAVGPLSRPFDMKALSATVSSMESEPRPISTRGQRRGVTTQTPRVRSRA